MLFGGIEAGGTKFICAIGNSSGEILARCRIPTTTPEETLHKGIDFFQQVYARKPFAAIGVASFGPIDLHEDSLTYGHITATPKPGWRNFDFVGAIRKVFDMPIGFDTDVNAAVIGEHRFGAARGLDTVMYVTVGTGIGAGCMARGKLMHGLTHPEMGHIFVPHDREKDPFAGVCPFHGDCLEGLASGPSMMKRWNVSSAMDLPIGHRAWEIEADHLSYAVANWILTLSPEKIILGGGVMKREELLPLIHQRVPKILNGYIQDKAILEDIENFIVRPGLGEDSGICGAIALAEQALKTR